MNYTLPDIKSIYFGILSGDSLNYFIVDDEVRIENDIVFGKFEFANASFSQSKVSDLRGSYFSKTFDVGIANISNNVSQFDRKKLAVIFSDCNDQFYITGYEYPFIVNDEESQVTTSENLIQVSLNQNSYYRINKADRFWTENADQIIFPRGGDFNIPQNFTGVTGNSIILTWDNPEYNVIYNSFSIIRTNPFTHPDGETTIITINDRNANQYVDHPDLTFGGLYKYRIAIAQDLNGGRPYRYTDDIEVFTTTFNKPNSLTAFQSGNSVVLNWSNPEYTIDVKSFSINRCEKVGEDYMNCQVLTFNNDGSATEYVDENIGQFGDKCYGYQIAVCLSEDGFDRLTYHPETAPLVDVCVENQNEIGLIEFTGNYLASKYYGSWILQPELFVSGGSGNVTIFYEHELNGGFTVEETQNIQFTGGTYHIYLNGSQRARSFSTTFNWTFDLIPMSGYTIGSGNTPISVSFPRRLPNPITGLDAVQNGGDVELTWNEIANDTGTTTQYGYIVNRFLTADFDNTNTVLGYVSGNTNTEFVDISAPVGQYTYFVRGASLNGESSSLYTSDASNQETITIT